MADFSGKVVWITGASSGIGEALACSLSALGARLILSARRGDRLLEVKGRCKGGADAVALLPLDVANADPAEPIVRQAVAAFGKVDILINSAGISQRSLATETKPDVVRTIMKTNFFGPVWLSTELARYWQGRHEPGQIVVITSLVGKLATPLRSSYSASKHAAHGYFDSLRSELAKDNIDVLVVIPGYVRTEISFSALHADGSKHGIMDPAQEHGMSAEVAASRIIKAIEKRKPEFFVALDGRTRFALLLQKIAPGLLRRMLPTANVT